MAVSRRIFKLTSSDWSASWCRAPPCENQFDNPSKFMVPMLLNFPEDSWVAIDNLTKDRSQFCLRNFPRSSIPALDMSHIIWQFCELMKGRVVRTVLLGTFQGNESYVMYWLWSKTSKNTCWFMVDNDINGFWRSLFRNVHWSCDCTHSINGFIKTTI